MYLTFLELNTLLKKPYFNTFLSKNISQYALYRGRFNAQVLTLRYSILVSEFTEQRMITSVINEVMSHFPPAIKNVRGLIEYDVILHANPLDQVNGSFYFWRANSNRNQVPNQETIVSLNHDNLFSFVRQAAQILPTDLDIYFVNSNVSVYKITSIIFSFISV
jgi:hypothetical protein